ncbi:MAG: NTP transferase domain-containing protein [Solobacterium sp.]|nr:NTP transferase domain-containing protein [Solobacterium sp.]
MNLAEYDVLDALYRHPFVNQRKLVKDSGHSSGVVSKTLKDLMAAGYVTENYTLSEKAENEFRTRAPKNAVILAAGYGTRMVPINVTSPKAFFEVDGEPLIERLIRQLHDVGIFEIHIVVGFKKETFEYLIDKYNVNLIVNRDYAAYNNLYSLKCAEKYLSNTYIIPVDIWSEKNPFRKRELYSWYMVSDLVDDDSDVRVNRKMELTTVPRNSGGNAMIGICYLLQEDSEKLKKKMSTLVGNPRYDDAFWERALYENGKMFVNARVVHSSDVAEINTYEELRDLDSTSPQLESDAMRTIAGVLHCAQDDIVDITVLKKGMTNRSFLFSVHGQKYIMRIPGEGTDRLIDRKEEAEVYRAISGKGLCDDPVYIDPSNGYKITKFLEGIRVCDSESEDDLIRCMEKLREFHGMRLMVDHDFDMFRQIEFYETLWNGQPSAYRDYKETKQNVMKLKPYIEQAVQEKYLTHIDAVPDNFLFYTDEEGKERLQLTDWEYAGMQDPHVDIAMFCIYSLYSKKQTDHLIDLYFEDNCPKETRTKIYAYVAVCGMLWSNWCEYKRQLGVEFGEYSLRQYRYAKEYYRYAAKEWGL